MSPSVNIQSDGHLPPPLWVLLFLYIFLRIDMLSHCSCFSMKKKIHISLLVSVVSGHCSQPLGLSPPPPSFDLMLISPRLVLRPERHTPQLLWNRLHRRLGGKGKGVRAQHSKQLRNDWTWSLPRGMSPCRSLHTLPCMRQYWTVDMSGYKADILAPPLTY